MRAIAFLLLLNRVLANLGEMDGLASILFSKISCGNQNNSELILINLGQYYKNKVQAPMVSTFPNDVPVKGVF